jgi:hypothetical protein
MNDLSAAKHRTELYHQRGRNPIVTAARGNRPLDPLWLNQSVGNEIAAADDCLTIGIHHLGASMTQQPPQPDPSWQQYGHSTGSSSPGSVNPHD